MNVWKGIFEKASNEFEDKDELELSYKFGLPASSDDFKEVEVALRIKMPSELCQMLGEFNGIEATDNCWGTKQLYLSTRDMIDEIPKYFRESGNYVPPQEELEKVIFFAQQNGYSALFALCIKPFNEFKVGDVLVVESDAGEFEPECNSLKDFVSSCNYCHLG